MFAHNGEKLTGGIFLIRLMGGMTTLLLPGVGFAAEAAGDAPQQNKVFGLVMPIAVFILIFYFLMYRPQKKKQQQHDKMLSSISRGDTVVTAGGFFGKVSDVLEDSYIVEIADGVRARLLKSSVSSKREGGDDKPRPRRLRKKKRPVRGENAETPDAIFEAAPSTEAIRAIEEGVTVAENEALMDDRSVQSPDEKETSSDSKK
jgi:preprotein translocase subunit YajC